MSVPTIKEENANELQQLLDKLECHRDQLRILLITETTGSSRPPLARWIPLGDEPEEKSRKAFSMLLVRSATVIRSSRPLGRRCRTLKSLEAEQLGHLKDSSLSYSSP